jgi:hypothetical protein
MQPERRRRPVFGRWLPSSSRAVCKIRRSVYPCVSRQRQSPLQLRDLWLDHEQTLFRSGIAQLEGRRLTCSRGAVSHRARGNEIKTQAGWQDKGLPEAALCLFPSTFLGSIPTLEMGTVLWQGAEVRAKIGRSPYTYPTCSRSRLAAQRKPTGHQHEHVHHSAARQWSHTFCFAIADRLESFVLEIIFPLLGLHPFREAAGFGPHHAHSGEPNATWQWSAASSLARRCLF